MRVFYYPLFYWRLLFARCDDILANWISEMQFPDIWLVFAVFVDGAEYGRMEHRLAQYASKYWLW